MTGIAAVWRNPGLRRLQFVVAISSVGFWGLNVALVVWAFQEGGAGTVALVALARLVPAAVLSPVLAGVLDRARRGRVLAAVELLRGTLTIASGVLLAASAPVLVVVVPLSVAAVVGSVFVPARAAITPALARDPEELAAANATSITVDSAGSFVAPALGGLLLVATSAQVVFFATGALMLASATLCRGFDPPGAASVVGADEDAEVPPTTGGALAVVRIVLADPGLRVVVALIAVQCVISGALDVLVASAAFDLLDAGSGTMGWLKAALGVGGLVGGTLAVVLVRDRLALAFAIGLVLWGVPLVLFGAGGTVLVGLVALSVVGVGNTIGDVAAQTLVQRLSPAHVLGRVFGLVETCVLAGFALGALLAPVGLELLGTQGALVAFGAALPVAVLLTAPALRRVDATEAPDGLERLRALPAFRSLPLPTLDAVARRLERLEFPAGTVLVRQGDPGERFFVLDAGKVDVTIDDVDVRRMGPGEAFGEIALLHDIPRTATIRAVEDVRVLTLSRPDFLEIVQRHAAASASLGGVAFGYLSSPAPTVPRTPGATPVE